MQDRIEGIKYLPALCCSVKGRSDEPRTKQQRPTNEPMTEHNTIETAREVEQDDLITLIFEDTSGERQIVVGEATYAQVYETRGGVDVGEYSLQFARGETRVEKWDGGEFVQVTDEESDITLVIAEKESERFEEVDASEVAL